ncbi:GlsB/YeaQ/YmgE family stress response membrane protein [Kribbia dieselivorans]|uniref:GlsB/YeaQ/YmgE family stress response membrane protein n=1 Tax=Kribbia dieselivorans TaxID=331526 RepID=UPI0008397780|nr:GlsB/YeaQ/YmgE family stress response membrane protein [Kribbia dieselivorans]
MPGEFGFIVWIIIGGLAGFIASRIMGTSKSQSWLMDIIIGIIGGLVGGWLLGIFIDTDGSGLIVTFLTALVGAVILLWLWKAVTNRR